MIRDITIGQYYEADSPIHRLDPRTKIIASLVYLVAVFLVEQLWFFGIIGACLYAVVKASKVPFKFILRGLKPIMFIITFAFVINVFLTPGTPLVSVWFLTITHEGLYRAALMAIRLLMLITGTSLLTLTTSPIVLTDGIERLLTPLKKIGVPAHELAMMMTIALRFIPTLIEETDKIMKAQMARGADFESGNIIQRAKGMVPLLVPLFISAFRRADELAIAMEARCYQGGDNRTRMTVLKYSRRDSIAYVSLFLFLAMIIAVNVMW